MTESPSHEPDSPREEGGDVGELRHAIVLMGVSGAGKTKLGRLLAARLDYRFVDADDFHSAKNREKMARGEGLDDADRRPWLLSLRSELERAREMREPLVLACSTLKADYRKLLGVDGTRVVLRYLRVSRVELERRLEKRRAHFATTSLLPSQFATLEEPSEAETIDGDGPVALVFEALLRSVEPHRRFGESAELTNDS